MDMAVEWDTEGVGADTAGATEEEGMEEVAAIRRGAALWVPREVVIARAVTSARRREAVPREDFRADLGLVATRHE